MTAATHPPLTLRKGDILEANPSAGLHLRFLLRVDSPQRRRGTRVYPTGHVSQEDIHPRVDRLVACGIHEDCRASLDLAMACAEERWRGHLASTDKGGGA